MTGPSLPNPRPPSAAERYEEAARWAVEMRRNLERAITDYGQAREALERARADLVAGAVAE